MLSCRLLGPHATWWSFCAASMQAHSTAVQPVSMAIGVLDTTFQRVRATVSTRLEYQRRCYGGTRAVDIVHKVSSVSWPRDAGHQQRRCHQQHAPRRHGHERQLARSSAACCRLGPQVPGCCGTLHGMAHHSNPKCWYSAFLQPAAKKVNPTLKRDIIRVSASPAEGCSRHTEYCGHWYFHGQ